eukprot:CAMPEP_0177787056 /NCGR_PEP_ID=MMETSP0491_2-20121128/21264_1 /TAXON_ID=63592 /ORGANISM="Tetraselmis chuii, Strain PLY429" /LENGTH=855 /DNA_ID=CAMNT_0019308331 /DNA_START=131 /DNA_END=2698 /DNA_ORIENTATION=-
MAEPMDASDSDVEVEASAEDQEAIMNIEEKLKANPYQLKLHKKYIELLRKVKLARRLRSARQALRELFPLSLEMWQQWIEDESAALKERGVGKEGEDSDDDEEVEEDKELLVELYEAATAEYLSVELWLSFLRFVVTVNTSEGEMSEEGVGVVREVGEKALHAAGMHLPEGGKLWDAVIAYEQGLLEAGWEPGKQMDRVRTLYHRRLAVPLFGMKDTMEAYAQWEAANGSEQVAAPKHIQKAHESALAMLDVRAPLEEKLAAEGASEEAVANTLLAYLRVEEATGDSARIVTLFERALVAIPSRLDIWSRYLNYSEENIKVSATVCSICRRAAYAVSSSGLMWARYLAAAERAGASAEEVADIYHRAMSTKLKGAGEYLEVVLARCDFLRRQGSVEALRSAFKTGQEKVSAVDAKFCDPQLRLLAYQAHCELQMGGGVEAARAVWEEALKAETGRLSSTWQAYVAFERAQRNIAQCRALYKKGYARKLEEGGQVRLCQDWLRFEREEGSADEHLQARIKCQSILDAAAAADAAKKAAAKNLSTAEMVAMRRAADPNFKAGEGAEKKAGEAAEGPPAKRARTEPVSAAPATTPASGPPGRRSNENIVFVKNMSRFTKTVGITKFFSRCPDLKDIRMPLDHVTGKPRGLAYVEFESKAGVDAALQLNGQELDGHQLLIVRSDPNRSGGGGESTDYVAFCRNLAFSTTEVSLSQVFSQCPGLKGVRLPLDHATGRVRGIGYIQFESRAGLDQALQLNGIEVDGRSISIEESGGGRFGGRFGGRGRYGGRDGSHMGGRRGGLSFSPSYGGGGGDSGFGSLVGGHGPPMAGMSPMQTPQLSNDQFRQMFLGGGHHGHHQM